MYAVGFMEGRAEDPSRPSWRSDAPRPLAWTMWRPSAPETPMRERLLGAPGQQIMTMGPLAEGAPFAGDRARWPVVLLSHGTGGSVQGLSWLGRGLAAAGFVCIGVNHHGNTASEPYLPEGFLAWWERAADLTAILDLLAADPEIGPRLDLDAVFSCGFSLGGYTALKLLGPTESLARFREWHAAQPRLGDGPREFPDLASRFDDLLASSDRFRRSVARHGGSYRDPRVRAAAAFAPGPPVRGFDPESVAAIDAPALLMSGEADREAPHDLCAAWLKERNPRFRLELLGAEIGHYVFLDEAGPDGRQMAPELFDDAPCVDRRAIHRRAVAAAVALFRAEMGLTASRRP